MKKLSNAEAELRKRLAYKNSLYLVYIKSLLSHGAECSIVHIFKFLIFHNLFREPSGAVKVLPT